jgi:hypothetical protein
MPRLLTITRAKVFFVILAIFTLAAALPAGRLNASGDDPKGRNDVASPSERGNAKPSSNIRPMVGPPPSACTPNLFASDTFVTTTGNGFNGSDTSVIDASHDSFGLNGNSAVNFSLADDFTVGGTWTPSKLTFFAYQTGTYSFPPTSTLTGIPLVRLWNGVPGGAGTVVAGPVAGTGFTTGWTNTHRVTSSTLTNAQRPIMYAQVDWPSTFPTTLTPGTYWLEWSFTGSLGSLFVPPANLHPGTDNAKQFDGTNWIDADMNSTVAGVQAVDFPFVICGSAGPTSTPTITPTGTFYTSTATYTNTPTATPTATNTPVTASCPGTLTTSSPFFTRPANGTPPTSLSSNTHSYYRDLPFTVSVSGTYTIEMSSAAFTSANTDDGFYILYSPSFSPAAPLVNAIEADDDDSPNGLQPLITRALTAGTQYVLVSTTFVDSTTGTFVDNFSGPGPVNFICSNATATPTSTATNTPDATSTPTATPSNTPTASNTPVPPVPDTIGVYENGLFFLRNSNTTGSEDILAIFGGDASDLPVVGDWNGDGVDTVGVYRNSTGFFFLSDSNTSPAVNYTVLFGNPGDTPFAGKWTVDMTGSGIGVYRNSNGILYQRKSLTSGFDDFFAVFGNPGDQGIAGDWDGNGFDSIGVYRNANTTWYMTNNSSPSGITFSDYDFVLDTSGAAVFAGDWDGDGDSTPGWLTSSGVFTLHPNNSIVGPDNVFAFGPANGLPVAGKWAAAGRPPVAGVINKSSNPSGSNPVDNSSGD